MSKLIHMHLFRTSKAKSTYVIGILMLVFLVLTLGLAYIIFENPFGIEEELWELVIGKNSDGTKPYMIHQFFVQGNSAFIILLTIFTVLMTTSDFTKGFVKNTYGIYKDKSIFVMAKWSAMVICVTVVYVVYSLMSLAAAGLIFSSFTSGDWSKYIESFLVIYVCLISLLSLVFMITSLFKSAAGGMVIGLILASGMMQTIEKLLDLLIAKLTGADMLEVVGETMGVTESSAFKISDYCIDNVFLSYSVDMSKGDTIRTVVVACVYAAIALGICTLLAKKKDVRC